MACALKSSATPVKRVNVSTSTWEKYVPSLMEKLLSRQQDLLQVFTGLMNGQMCQGDERSVKT